MTFFLALDNSISIFENNWDINIRVFQRQLEYNKNSKRSFENIK